MGTVAGLFSQILALLATPVRVAEFVEHAENLAGHGNDDIVDRLGRKLGEVDGVGGLLGHANAREGRRAEQDGHRFR